MRKLSFEENLRHRLNDSLHGTQKTLRKKLRPMQKDLRKRMRNLPGMKHDDGMSTQGIVFLSLGIVAGIAAGVLLAQKYGGFGAVGERIRGRFRDRQDHDDHDHHRFNGQGYESDHDYDDGHDDFGELSPMEELEERVLEAYRNDPILSERAIDIGAIDNGIIELTGWVHASEEATHAVTIARGTPGVDTVVNRLTVRAEEDRYDEFSDRYDQDYDSHTEAQWNGQRRGMGRPGASSSEEIVDGLDGYGQAAAGTGGEDAGSRRSSREVPQADHVSRPRDEGESPLPPRGD